jgi:hypothetical protein
MAEHEGDVRPVGRAGQDMDVSPADSARLDAHQEVIGGSDTGGLDARELEPRCWDSLQKSGVHVLGHVPSLAPAALTVLRVLHRAPALRSNRLRRLRLMAGLLSAWTERYGIRH